MADPLIPLDLAKAHLRLGDDASQDALVAAKLEMAIAIAEDITGRVIRTRSVERNLLLPPDDTLLINLPVPTTEISEVEISNHRIPPDRYQLLASDFDSILYIDRAYGGSRVTIRCVAGYNQTTLPPAIKAAILLLLGTLFDNESDQIIGRSVNELSLTAEKLLLAWRITPYGECHV